MPNKKRRKDVRNMAIIAHADHGKTTRVDALLKQTGAHAFKDGETTVMDSNPLESDLPPINVTPLEREYSA
jgi:GTP-binding protein